MNRLIAATSLFSVVTAGNACTDGGNGGCSPPQGSKWNRWDMAGSTYTYCYHDCPMDWFIENTKKLSLNEFGGMVGVDHYWTKQGMPCVDGKPQEFQMQNNLSEYWKSSFPTMRFMSYRILSAVPYDMIVRDKMLSNPEYFIRWNHLPGSTEPGNGSICYNYISACFNDPTRINDPSHHCSFEIRAAAYNWVEPGVIDWYVNSVIAPALDHCDGVWLDGNGPDNGAYMCSGICCGFGPENSPQNETEIEAFCDGNHAAAAAAREYMSPRGGFDIQGCTTYFAGSELPSINDSPSQCGDKLLKYAHFGSNHSNYNLVVAYGSRTAGTTYNDETAAASVAAFLLMRGEHWFLSFYPSHGKLNETTARLLTSDYGMPKGNATAVPNKPNVFFREFEKATVTLDCNTFSGHFDEH